MADYAEDIARLEAIVEDVRRIRTRTCEPKANSNPRYLALSKVVTNLTKAIEDIATTCSQFVDGSLCGTCRLYGCQSSRSSAKTVWEQTCRSLTNAKDAP